MQYQGKITDIRDFLDRATSCRQCLRTECVGGASQKDHGSVRDRNGNKLPYWPGGPSTGGCACGITNSCYDSHKCNCYTNKKKFLSDYGCIVDKNRLPITKLAYGDTGHSEEYIYYTLGDVECDTEGKDYIFHI